MTIQEAQVLGRKTLNENTSLSRSTSINLDVDVFLQEIFNCDKSFLLFKRETPLNPSQESQFLFYLEQRNTGLPVAYIIGKKEFFSYQFLVTKDVLIPKPDTELLVEKAIETIEEKSSQNKILTICDMCTGSGCVGISLLKYITEKNIVPKDKIPKLILADISDKALEIAKTNAKNLLSEECFENLSFIRSNLFSNINKSFDLIVTNPPYVPQKESLELLKDGRREPLLALNGDIDLEGNWTGENDGLGIIKNLVPQAWDSLCPGGVLILESGEYNAIETEKIFRQTGFKHTQIFKDLSGQLRDTIGTK